MDGWRLSKQSYNQSTVRFCSTKACTLLVLWQCVQISQCRALSGRPAPGVCPLAIKLCFRWSLTEAPKSLCIFFSFFTCRSRSAILQYFTHVPSACVLVWVFACVSSSAVVDLPPASALASLASWMRWKFRVMQMRPSYQPLRSAGSI